MPRPVRSLLASLLLLSGMSAALAQDHDFNPPWSLGFEYGHFAMAETIGPSSLLHTNHNEFRTALLQQGTGEVIQAQTYERGSGFFLQRFDRRGWIDLTFAASAGRFFTVDPTDSDRPKDIYLVKDASDRLYVALARTSDIVVCGLTRNGELRPEFGATRARGSLVAGCFSIPYEWGWSTGSMLGLQVDHNNRVVIAGTEVRSPPFYRYGLFVERMDADGTLDTSFGASGRVRIEEPYVPLNLWLDSNYFRSLAVGNDSSVYIMDTRHVAVASTNPLRTHYLTRITKLTPNGRADSAFGDAGATLLASPYICARAQKSQPACVGIPSTSNNLRSFEGLSMVLDGGNQLLVLANAPDSATCPAASGLTECGELVVTRLTQTGTFDPRFGTNGITRINQQLPDIWVTTDIDGTSRASFLGGTDAQILATPRKDGYATVVVRMETILSRRRADDPANLSWRTDAASRKHVIIPLDNAGRFRDDAEPLLDFGRGPPSNCAYARPQSVIYGQEARSYYVYTGGTSCIGSALNPMMYNFAGYPNNPVYYISKILHQ